MRWPRLERVVEVDDTDVLAIPLPLGGSNCRDLALGPGAPANESPPHSVVLRIEIDGCGLDIAHVGSCRRASTKCGVLLQDAAGNRTPIFGLVTCRMITSSATPLGRGLIRLCVVRLISDGASDLARLIRHWGRRGSGTLLVSRFRRDARGARAAADRGRGADRQAAIDVVSKTTAVNARELAKRAGPRTGADGTWRAVLPASVSSRDVTFRYRSHVNDTIAAATASVRLRVRAGRHLTINPRRARQGQAIHFEGRLLGGPLPRGGKQIVLMARASRGGWVRFKIVRSDGGGRSAPSTASARAAARPSIASGR